VSAANSIQFSDVLAINFLAFSKAFDYGPGNDAANPGGSVNLTFKIENLNQSETVGELAFNLERAVDRSIFNVRY